MLSGIHRTTAEDAVGPRCTSLSRSRNPCPRAACVSKRYILIRESAAKARAQKPSVGGLLATGKTKKPGHFGPDELPCVIIIVDPLARRVRETEAHVMLFVESSERDKVAAATAHQPLVPACANGRLSSRTTPYHDTLEAGTAPLQIHIRRAAALAALRAADSLPLLTRHSYTSRRFSLSSMPCRDSLISAFDACAVSLARPRVKTRGARSI